MHFSHDPTVTIQWVRHRWTKASRGGAGAARRARLPVAFALPEPAPSDRFFVHRIDLDEEEDFVARVSDWRGALEELFDADASPTRETRLGGRSLRTLTAAAALEFRAHVVLSRKEDRLSIALAPNPHSAPPLPARPPFLLEPGAVAHLEHLQRWPAETFGFRAQEPWAYVRTVFHVAWCVRYEADLFRARVPDVTFVFRPRLR
jgi:hypothetical protein